jgi:hypothetical protein
LSPFSIELNQDVPEIQIQDILSLYLSNNMMLNENTNESIKLSGTPKLETAHKFRYTGTLFAENAMTTEATGVRQMESSSSYLTKQLVSLQDTASLNELIQNRINVDGLHNAVTNNDGTTSNYVPVVKINVCTSTDNNNSTTTNTDDNSTDVENTTSVVDNDVSIDM